MIDPMCPLPTKRSTLSFPTPKSNTVTWHYKNTMIRHPLCLSHHVTTLLFQFKRLLSMSQGSGSITESSSGMTTPSATTPINSPRVASVSSLLDDLSAAKSIDQKPEIKITLNWFYPVLFIISIPYLAFITVGIRYISEGEFDKELIKSLSDDYSKSFLILSWICFTLKIWTSLIQKLILLKTVRRSQNEFCFISFLNQVDGISQSLIPVFLVVAAVTGAIHYYCA